MNLIKIYLTGIKFTQQIKIPRKLSHLLYMATQHSDETVELNFKPIKLFNQ